jgi:hypothetical protein
MKEAVRRKASIIPVLLSSRDVGDVSAKTTPRRRDVRPLRRAFSVPVERPVARVPGGDTLLHVPPPHFGRVPDPRPVLPPPNPRTPRLIRDVHGGALLDLFDIFPDLPRPPRPEARLRRGVKGRTW